MGEYALHEGREIKIGTCEDMYYLRADQRHQVQRLPGNVNPATETGIRFRFPWPDEDGKKPGSFEPPDRGICPGYDLKPPAEVEHCPIQFKADAGYLVSLPCPEAPHIRDLPNLRIHRNGFQGAVLITQQRPWEGHLVLVCMCGGCGTKYRLPTLEDAKPVIDACRKRAAESCDDWWSKVADRIEAGYKL